MPVLKILGKKLPVHLLLIINASSDDIVLTKNKHLGEMKPLSSIDDPLKPLGVNEVTYATDSNYVDEKWMQPDSFSYKQCRIPSNLHPVPRTSILRPGNVRLYRQVLLSDAKIQKKLSLNYITCCKNMMQ